MNSRCPTQPAEGIPQRAAGDDDLEPSLTKTEETPLSPLAAAGGLDGLPSVCQVGRAPLAQSETIEPQILAEIELRTAAHIDETYRTLSNRTKPRFLVWAAVAALLLASTLFWLSRPRTESSVADNRTASDSKVEELALPEDPLKSLREDAQMLFDAGMLHAAEQVCDDILVKNERDTVALALKERIRSTLSELKSEAALAQSQEAEKAPRSRPHWINLSKHFPGVRSLKTGHGVRICLYRKVSNRQSARSPNVKNLRKRLHALRFQVIRRLREDCLPLRTKPLRHQPRSLRRYLQQFRLQRLPRSVLTCCWN